MIFLKRHLQDKLIKAVKHFKILLLVGARQVGKSTILKTLFPDYKHIVFDPVQDIYNARKDPDLFLDNFSNKVILDEFQYTPEILPALKRKVDESSEAGQYLMIGSQNISMLKTVAESLAGRVVIFNLDTMSDYEIEAQIDSSYFLETYLENPDLLITKFKGTLSSKTNLYTRLWRGNFPGLLEIPDEFVANYFSSYVQTYIERDVRLIENIKDLGLFEKFFSLLSALTAQEINYSQLGRELGLSPSSASRWLDILKISYQWLEIPAYSGNTIKRISKKPKGYIIDTGLGAYLQRIDSAESLARQVNFGAIFETHCINLINKLSSTLSTKPMFYHWRSSNNAEVDLILELNDTLYPIEIKSKSNISKRDTSGIKAFISSYPKKNIAQALIVYAGKEIYKVEENIIAMPWNSLIS